MDIETLNFTALFEARKSTGCRLRCALRVRGRSIPPSCFSFQALIRRYLLYNGMEVRDIFHLPQLRDHSRLLFLPNSTVRISVHRTQHEVSRHLLGCPQFCALRFGSRPSTITCPQPTGIAPQLKHRRFGPWDQLLSTDTSRPLPRQSRL